MRKLAKERVRFYLIRAWQKSESSRPYSDYFRAGEALGAYDTNYRDIVSAAAETKMGALARYRDKYGEPPAEMTIAELAKLAGRHPTIIPITEFNLLFGMTET
jgi:hypothetical protein